MERRSPPEPRSPPREIGAPPISRPRRSGKGPGNWEKKGKRKKKERIFAGSRAEGRSPPKRAQEIGKRRKKERKKKEYSREAGRRGGAPQKGPRKLGKEGKKKEKR